ncbi:MAG: hypothetical protein RMK84_12210 [Oscillochloridaceae bacterium]|nr:hypothetical protein [Chloroflexaceae bacterium]MDW8390882.1 hypothetical protein [Oscillochloridaceae bacterium]
MTQHEPTIASILRGLAHEYDGPVEERRILERVLERRPSSAKNPYATIRERLRWDGLKLGWVRLNRTQLVPLRVALEGLRFRCLPRPQDVEAGVLPLAHLQPFAGQHSGPCELRSPDGSLLATFPAEVEEHPAALPAFNLQAWYARSGFVPGDSILMRVVRAEPLVVEIEREARDDFRSAAVAEQDAELIEAIIERVRRAQVALVPCNEVILPIFAAASWRASYPGSPWQHLVLRDGRVYLVDDTFLTTQPIGALPIFGADEVFEAPAAGLLRRTSDDALLAEIDALQHDLLQARQRDAEAGLWSGQVQRASAFGAARANPGRSSFFSRLNHDDDDDDWSNDESWDADTLADGGTIDPDDPMVILAARERMLSLLSPEAAEQIRSARPEDVELLITRHLNDLLARAPDLFPRLELVVPEEQSDDDLVLDMLSAGDWQEVWEGAGLDDFDDDLDDDFDGDIDVDESDDVARANEDLLGQFQDYLLEMGKSATTARARVRALAIYANFLESYYGRNLAEGDYATLDECLFYYYPHRVGNTSARQVREICTAIKQFYAFLQQRGVVSDGRFAEALWRRRDQAARVVEIYERISSESPNFDLLFDRLFRPYTD